MPAPWIGPSKFFFARSALNQAPRIAAEPWMQLLLWTGLGETRVPTATELLCRTGLDRLHRFQLVWRATRQSAESFETFFGVNLGEPDRLEVDPGHA